MILPTLIFSQTKSKIMGDKKIVIYQLLPRLFGNTNTTNKTYGSLEENGTGKFNDIDEKALNGLKELSVNYVWYTGIIAHASLTDYSKFGIPNSDADVVKGIAGSPYAIRDYYDVDPDLAVNVPNRMQEFENLVQRTHAAGLKVIIDFVPNHVARGYHSNVKPKGVEDFGENDDTTKSFSPKNDFYYLNGQNFMVPDIDKVPNPTDSLKDYQFNESPAKATGNNSFSAKPKDDDWYETIKLNYGVDYQNGEKTYFDPIPPVWVKMKDILVYWSKKGVDGFRCDVAEMVPVEFWQWMIPQVKKEKPDLIFIGEAYNPKVYSQYLNQGGFDYLYDKVGLYDALKKLIRNQPDADVAAISQAKNEVQGFDDKMLRFLENHDEERIASKGFAGDANFALPAMVVTATLGKSPVMVYFGQEVGEPAKGIEGFGKDDNRTTIFDYWGVPNHQKWMNNGLFDGGQLDENQKDLREFYKNLLKISSQNEAISNGDFYEVPQQEINNNRVYAYFRYTNDQRLLIISNFNRTESFEGKINLPSIVLNNNQPKNPVDLLSNKNLEMPAGDALNIKLAPNSSQIIQF
ncbi:alpha-glucosidase C-terminal domain-containing protein [Pedobacter sp. SD-b]|uniref:Alpha-glucosidase C-terminal domain-containing protein n=2 Tax=Pedobacter segetis TaxID=2793069 RepID=A0ABS1BMZ3_9SPHI|nr:alpha-glucosidase C-terminal domain-containing protein [Pedobacter segetis]